MTTRRARLMHWWEWLLCAACIPVALASCYFLYTYYRLGFFK